MFDPDKWQEILATIKQNKLRTFLTGFSVAWGIFMLMILLGAGNGLKNGAEYQFSREATNSIFIYDGRTNKLYEGLQKGRRIYPDNQDHEWIKQNLPELDKITANYSIWGDNMISYKGKYGDFNITAIHPAHSEIENLTPTSGRFINSRDIQKKRKVACIGQNVADELFEKGEEPIGKDIEIKNLVFKVAGVFSAVNDDRELRKVYIPISTAQQIFSRDDKLHSIKLTTKDISIAESKAIVEKLRGNLSKKHYFAPNDERAVYIRNNLENYQNFQNVFKAISVFIWIIGIGTIIAGIVGVSNIMIIVVKERTLEIGIRKAIGATPGSIVGLVIFESILITTFAGYIGLVAGVGILSVLSNVLPANDFFMNPQVNLGIAGAATLLLVACGTIAGLFPARKASKIKPIVALRDE
ncbi:MAG: ABC transporter permease [Bacteroidota bacterium]